MCGRCSNWLLSHTKSPPTTLADPPSEGGKDQPFVSSSKLSENVVSTSAAASVAIEELGVGACDEGGASTPAAPSSFDDSEHPVRAVSTSPAIAAAIRGFLMVVLIMS